MTISTISHRGNAKATTSQKTFTLNNTTGSDIIVIATLNSADQPLLQAYELSLSILSTTGGKSIIKSQEQGTVLIDDSFDASTNEIIIAKADSLFPVKLQLLSPDSESQNYSAITITPNDAAAMLLAEKFIKTITAFPSSDLSKDFSAALEDTDVTRVNEFFLASVDYKTVRLEMIVAVQTYYSQYSFGWLNNKAKMKYHLYASDGTKNTGLGTVTITNKITSPASIDKPSADFRASYVNGDDTTALYFSEGQFVSDVNSSAPAICLQGSFILKSQFTKIDTDNTLISILSGTANNNNVMAMEEDLDKNGDDKWYDADVLLHPKDTIGWVILIGGIIGAIVIVGILCKTAKMAFDAARRNKVIDRPSANEKLRADMQKAYDKLGITTKLPDNISARWNKLKQDAIDLLLAQNKDALMDINKRQGDYLNDLLAISDSQDIQMAIENVGDNYMALLETSARDLPANMGKLTNDVKTVSANIDVLRKKYSSKIKSDEKKTLDKSRETIEKITDSVEKGEELRDELQSDTISEIRE